MSEPTTSQSDGKHRKHWKSDHGYGLVIESSAHHGIVSGTDEECAYILTAELGEYLSARQAREVATHLLALADEAEARKEARR